MARGDGGVDLAEAVGRWRDAAAVVRSQEPSGGEPDLVDGTDDRSTVTVRLDAHCRVVAVQPRGRWRDLGGPEEFGRAVLDAVAAAVGHRIGAVADLLPDDDLLPGEEVWEAMARDLASGSVPAVGPVPAVADLTPRPAGVAARLDRLEHLLAALPGVGAERVASAGRSGRGEVEVEIDASGLPNRVTCRPGWWRATPVDRVAAALAQAFAAAYAASDRQEVIAR